MAGGLRNHRPGGRRRRVWRRLARQRSIPAAPFLRPAGRGRRVRAGRASQLGGRRHPDRAGHPDGDTQPGSTCTAVRWPGPHAFRRASRDSAVLAGRRPGAGRERATRLRRRLCRPAARRRTRCAGVIGRRVHPDSAWTPPTPGPADSHVPGHGPATAGTVLHHMLVAHRLRMHRGDRSLSGRPTAKTHPGPNPDATVPKSRRHKPAAAAAPPAHNAAAAPLPPKAASEPWTATWACRPGTCSPARTSPAPWGSQVRSASRPSSQVNPACRGRLPSAG